MLLTTTSTSSPFLPFSTTSPRRSRRGRHLRPHRHRLLLRCSLNELLPLVGPTAAAAAALFSGAALLISTSSSSHKRNQNDRTNSDAADVAGSWVLFTSPTPFNRSVLLRCPSVSFEDGGLLLDGVNNRLLTEERHYINLSRGNIPRSSNSSKRKEIEEEEDLSYQRVCIGAEDGGVISLDWPDNLELEKEHGLDSTVVIVPGTAKGSMERCVKLFVLDALKHGYFPVVMNPRGCAGSPLTTAR